MVHFVNFSAAYWLGDCSAVYQLGFQDPATTTMEGIFLFNLHLLFVIIGIVLLVAWLLFIILRNFTELTNSNVANFTHSNLIEMCDPLKVSIIEIFCVAFGTVAKKIL